jgi:sortase A
VDEWQKAIGEDLPRDGALSGADLLPPAPGSLYARMTSDDVQLNAPVYFGDTDEIFGKGAGQYILSGLPGEGEPILLGGHDVSWFASLEDIAPGDEITLTTSYGVFVYQVSQTFVAKADEVTWDGLSATSGERLVLYTCYPIGSLLGVREDRLFVLCDKASGPRIIKTGGSL